MRQVPVLASLILLGVAAGCGAPPKPPPPTPAQQQSARGAEAFSAGDRKAAARRYREALAAARAANNGPAVAQALYNLSAVLLAEGDAEQARTFADQIVMTEVPRGRLAAVSLLRARIALARGDADQAEAILGPPRAEAPLSVEERLARVAIASLRKDWKATAELAAGLPDELAEKSYAQGAAAAGQSGPPAEASASFLRAAELAGARGQTRLMADALEQAALACAADGKPREAAEHGLRAAQIHLAEGRPLEAGRLLPSVHDHADAADDEALLRRVAAFGKELSTSVKPGTVEASP